LYDATYNNYFQALIRAYTIDTGRTWKELPPETQRQIIADAKKLAEIYTKEDLEVEMGLPIRSEQVDDEEYEEE
jgi:excinuclease UvrABC ATPase subunit